ncbi:MAG: hypothetical protein ABR559_08835 [Gemmatimonadota bacterium]
MAEPAFAALYAALWGILFVVLFRLGRQSRELRATIRQIKRHLHSGWPDPD